MDLNSILTHSETYETTRRPSISQRVVSLLREVGDSLSASEIAEETDLTEKQVLSCLKTLCSADDSSRCVYGDDEDGYSYSEPIVDHIVIGF